MTAPLLTILLRPAAGLMLLLSAAAADSLAGPTPRAVRKDRHGDALPDGVIARLGTVRFRRASPPLAFSPDGKLLASTPTDAGGIVLWERATGRALRRIGEKEGGSVQRIAFAPDGKRVAVSWSGHCCVYDVAGGRQLFSVPGSHGSFSADGKLLVTADGRVEKPHLHVYDGKTGRPRGSWSIGRGAEYLSLAADGRTVALVDDRDPPVARVCAVATGKEIRAINLAPTGRALALSADGKLLAAAGGKEVRLWDVATGKEVRRWARRADSSPVFSPDGKRLAWTGYDEEMGIARTWVVERDGDRPRPLGEPTNNFAAPCFSPDGKVLAVLSDGGALLLRDVGTGKEERPLDAHASAVYRIAANDRLVLTGDRSGVFVWDRASGRLLRRFRRDGPHDQTPLPLPSGDRVLTSHPGRRTVQVCDAVSGREVLRLPGQHESIWMALSGDGRTAALLGADEKLRVFDLDSGKLHCRIDPKGDAFALGLSPDGRYLVWYRDNEKEKTSEVCLSDARTGRPLHLAGLPDLGRLPGFTVGGRCFSPDGRWFIFPGGKRTLRRWDLRTGKEGPALHDTQALVFEVFYSPDGRLVGTYGSEGRLGEVSEASSRVSVRLWDLTAGTPLTHLNPQPVPGERVLFSPDARTLVTSNFGTIYLWEIATGRSRGRLISHQGWGVTGLLLTPDGRQLISGGSDTQVLVWDLTGRSPDGRWQAVRLSAEQRRSSWEALAGADAAAAYRATWTLAADPEPTLALLREHLRPVASPDAARLARLIADLDHDRFAVRERARAELEKLGDAAAGELRRALAKSPPLEVRRRLDALLVRCERPPAGEALRALRSVEVLERIGTAEARRLLSTLAGGASGARLSREAAASVGRLGGR